MAAWCLTVLCYMHTGKEFEPYTIIDILSPNADWPALTKWNITYLNETMGDTPVEVDLSPNKMWHQPSKGHIVR